MIHIDGIPIADGGVYLNLDKDRDRRTFFESQLEDYKITGVTRFPGVDRQGRTGSRDSHIGILKHIVEKQFNYTLIFEDDAKFTSNFTTEYFIDLISKFKQDSSLDLLWLGGKIQRGIRYNDKFNLALYRSAALGILITLNGAKKVLENEPSRLRQSTKYTINCADSLYNSSVFGTPVVEQEAYDTGNFLELIQLRQVFGDRALVCEADQFRSNNSNGVLNGDRRPCINYIKDWEGKFKRMNLHE